MNTPSLGIAATYVALLLSVLGLWIGRWVWIGALAVAIALGYASHVLQGPAVLWIAAFAALCFAFRRARTDTSLRFRAALVTLCALGIIVLGLLLALHLAPGFHNFLVLDKVVLSPGAEPYTLYLNFDKTVVGICLLGLCHPALLNRTTEWTRATKRGAPLAVGNVMLVAVVALIFGYLTWQPKWTSLFWIWAPVNLFYVCLAEEAFFRGFIQRELSAAFKGTRLGAVLAVSISALLFGLAHLAGGVTYVVLATLAGLGYAIVYQRTKSIEMSMLAHFALNTTHFILFTYPSVRL
jgi:membrane protease YdiL (CAAX protease family)